MKVITLIEDTLEDMECDFEHGLALYIEIQQYKLLFDTGATGRFVENAAKLGIDLNEIDKVIISHGHYDHAGGLLKFCEINNHAQIYMQKNATEECYYKDTYIGIDNRILNLPQLKLVDGSYKIDDNLYLISNVPTEKRNIKFLRKVDGKITEDDFSHEQSLVICTKKGNALISGCAHCGIINILEAYKKKFANEPMVVISGFHMFKKGGYTKEEIANIESIAKKLNKMYTIFYTGHCTGDKAYEIMHKIMKDKLKAIHTGKIVEIKE